MILCLSFLSNSVCRRALHIQITERLQGARPLACVTIVPIRGHLASAPPFFVQHVTLTKANLGDVVLWGGISGHRDRHPSCCQNSPSCLSSGLFQFPHAPAMEEDACFSPDPPVDYAAQFLDLCQTDRCKSSNFICVHWCCFICIALVKEIEQLPIC